MSVLQGHCCVLIACSPSGISLGLRTTFSGGVSRRLGLDRGTGNVYLPDPCLTTSPVYNRVSSIGPGVVTRNRFPQAPSACLKRKRAWRVYAMNATETISNWIVNTSYEDIPPRPFKLPGSLTSTALAWRCQAPSNLCRR